MAVAEFESEFAGGTQLALSHFLNYVMDIASKRFFDIHMGIFCRPHFVHFRTLF
jgi:hypothetical protein